MYRILNSFKYAYEGIVYVFTSQRNMQVHLSVAVLVLFLSMILEIPKYQLLMVFFSIVFVMCMELINTAIEKTVDLITTEHHPLAKIAKDVAAGAVLFAAIFAFVIGLYVFIDPLISLFSIEINIHLDRFIIVIILSFLLSFFLKRAPFLILFFIIAVLITFIMI